MKSVISVLGVVLIVGCAGPDTSKQLDTARSWTATSILVGERWLNHSIPDAYSAKALRNSSEELRKISTEIGKSLADSSSARRDSIVTAMKSASLHASRMAAEVREKNAPAFALQLDSLRDASRILETASPRGQQ